MKISTRKVSKPQAIITSRKTAITFDTKYPIPILTHTKWNYIDATNMQLTYYLYTAKHAPFLSPNHFIHKNSNYLKSTWPCLKNGLKVRTHTMPNKIPDFIKNAV